MGTVFTALLLALLAAAVYFAGRSIRRRKGCGGDCAHCASRCSHADDEKK